MPLRLGEDCYCSRNLILMNTLYSVDSANEPVSLPFTPITIMYNNYNSYNYNNYNYNSNYNSNEKCV